MNRLFSPLLFLAMLTVLPAQSPIARVTITLPSSVLADMRIAVDADIAAINQRGPRSGAPKVASPTSEEFLASNIASIVARMVVTSAPDLAPRLTDEAAADWQNRVMAQYKSQITVVIQ